MMRITKLPDDELSDDGNDEKLRFENEILKLKMQAQYGALFGSESELSPQMENAFLQNVLRFEEAFNYHKTIKVREAIGDPPCKNIEGLSDDEVDLELSNCFKQLRDQDIHLHVSGKYPARQILRFIMEELYEEEIDVVCPGMSKIFIYEEFHPNHKMDIENCAVNFMEGFFKRDLFQYSAELNDQFVLSDRRQLTKKQVISKVDTVRNSLNAGLEYSFFIEESAFQWNDETNCGLGHAEGIIQFERKSSGGEKFEVKEKFKFYMSSEGLGWSIFYLVFPGFDWVDR